MTKTDGNPLHLIETETQSRREYLQGILEADPTLPDFANISKIPGTYGTLIGIQDMLERAIENHSRKGKPQVIAITGPHANGKTQLLYPALRYVEKRVGERPKAVLYDEAIDVSRQIVGENEDAIIFPSHTRAYMGSLPGERDPSYYRATNFAYQNILRMALKEGGIILTEAPASAGMRTKRKGHLGEKDRGTTALKNLSIGKKFVGLQYDFYASALLVNPELHRGNLAKRSSESDEQISQRYGSTHHGSVAAIREIPEWLPDFYENEKGISLDPEIFDDDTVRWESLAHDVFQ